MNDPLWRAVTEEGQNISAAIAAEPDSALLAFDFDGTLAPIVERAEEARMSEQAASQLARIGPRVANLAIVTGRPVETVLDLGRLAERQGMENLIVFGNYGAERWDANSGRIVSPPPPDCLPAVRRELTQLLESRTRTGSGNEGIRLEEKGRAIGVHYRLSPDPEKTAGWLLPEIEAITARHGLGIEPGRLVIELRSPTVTKGDALNTLIAEADPKTIVFAGDDLGDLPAFEACLAARGEGLAAANVVAWSTEADQRVSSRADIWCRGTEGVASWLAHLAGLLG